jgi:hypothetical protein
MWIHTRLVRAYSPLSPVAFTTGFVTWRADADVGGHHHHHHLWTMQLDGHIDKRESATATTGVVYNFLVWIST